MPTAVETTEVERTATRSDAPVFKVSNEIERRTFRRAGIASALAGSSQGMFSLNAYVALVALGGTAAGYEAEISTLIMMLPSVAMLFASIYNSGGRVRRRRKYFLLAAGVGEAPFLLVPLLVLLPFSAAPFVFVGLVTFAAVVGAGVPPALNQLWGSNYVTETRGKRFAWFSAIGMFFVMLSAFAAGEFLDAAPVIDGVKNWQLLYPASALLGAAGMLTYYSIRVRYARAIEEADSGGRNAFKRLQRSYGRVVALLRRDRDFLQYEAGFFLYGIAFMMMLPAVPVLFSKYLRADYSDFSRASVVTVQISLMVMAPLVAWFARGRRVTVVTGVAFLGLIAYPVVLGITAITQEIRLSYLAFALFGIAMSGVHFAWNLGPVAFARGSNPLAYTSTHTSLVGARSLIGFPISYVLMKAFPESLTPIFIGAVAMLLVAVLIIFRLDRRMRRDGLNHTT